MESVGKHWVSEVACSRHIQWQDQWRRVDAVAAELRRDHPESFRLVRVRCRHGDTKQRWAFTKVVRLKRYGRKRLVMWSTSKQTSVMPPVFCSLMRCIGRAAA
jgi:hypothetical protein